MNLLDLYVKIGVDSKDAETGIKNTSKSGEKLGSVLENISDQSETLQNKIAVLSSRYDTAQGKVEKLSEAFNKSVQENGAASKESAVLAEKLKDAENEASALKKELDGLSSSVSETEEKVNHLGSSVSKLKSGLATAGKVAAAGVGLVTTAAGAAVGALSALEGATEEYRVAQGKLNTAFDAAGLSADAARESYYAFYGILGDTDTATEASQLLAKLVENEEDVVDWTDIAAGVFGTFGDSLPIEGLIEASNETAKVGLG